MARSAIKIVRDDQVSNDGAADIARSEPYIVSVTIEGSAPLLFHRWDSDAVATKASAAKGSAAKKADNLESYVYRTSEGHIGLPGEYLRQAIIHAAKFEQDPRSPRKSAMDLFKAGVVPMTLLGSLGVEKWDFEDRRRVMVQRNAVTRTRPAMREGWKVEIQLQVLLPEYIGVDLLRKVVDNAGRLVGVGDFRPTYGRFTVVNWSVGLADG